MVFLMDYERFPRTTVNIALQGGNVASHLRTKFLPVSPSLSIIWRFHSVMPFVQLIRKRFYSWSLFNIHAAGCYRALLCSIYGGGVVGGRSMVSVVSACLILTNAQPIAVLPGGSGSWPTFGWRRAHTYTAYRSQAADRDIIAGSSGVTTQEEEGEEAAGWMAWHYSE